VIKLRYNWCRRVFVHAAPAADTVVVKADPSTILIVIAVWQGSFMPSSIVFRLARRKVNAAALVVSEVVEVEIDSTISARLGLAAGRLHRRGTMFLVPIVCTCKEG